ncbi:MAG: YcxB family protein [Eubacteriales bacterium]|nr:YcxB family protein [Eubacteriales bacterium]
MVIKNKTKITDESITGVMRASNFDNDRYKKFKIIYNLFGLLFGMMLVQSLVKHMLGSAEADTFLTVFFAVGTVIFLYIGMAGMDKSNKKRFQNIYNNMKGVTFTYTIDSEDIKVTDEEDDSDMFSWEDIVKWNQDMEYFYLFVNQENCLIIDKKGFISGTEKDLKELATAVFAIRQKVKEKENDN